TPPAARSAESGRNGGACRSRPAPRLSRPVWGPMVRWWGPERWAGGANGPNHERVITGWAGGGPWAVVGAGGDGGAGPAPALARGLGHRVAPGRLGLVAPLAAIAAPRS